MAWEIELHDDVADWLLALRKDDPESHRQVRDGIDLLEEHGPALRRPMVGEIKASRYHNMKELRPASAGATEVRILFIFDPQRRAILLVAGDKAGNWDQWYRQNIPIADERYAEHLAAPEAKKEGRDESFLEGHQGRAGRARPGRRPRRRG